MEREVEKLKESTKGQHCSIICQPPDHWREGTEAKLPRFSCIHNLTLERVLVYLNAIAPDVLQTRVFNHSNKTPLQKCASEEMKTA